MARDGKKSSSEPDGKEKKKKRHEDESEDELDRMPKKSRKKHETSSEDDEEGGGKSEKLSSRSKRKEKEKEKKKMKSRSRKRYSDDDDDDDEEDYSSSSTEYSESETESGSERSEYTETDSEEERRRKKRKRKRKEREYEKEKRRRRKEKERRRRKKEKEKEAKERKRKKEGKITAVTNKWGKYGIIRETDMWNKRPEFTAWLAEVKQVNLESLPNWEEKQMFKEFMEDHNTATFPSKKYYNLDAYHRHKLEKQVKKGMKKVNETERTVFDDEGQRRQELKIAREKQKEETVEVLKRSMQSGMAQAMKEQAQLREEMAYQYKLGNFEAAAAIQRRLDPDVAM